MSEKKRPVAIVLHNAGNYIKNVFRQSLEMEKKKFRHLFVEYLSRYSADKTRKMPERVTGAGEESGN